MLLQRIETRDMPLHLTRILLDYDTAHRRGLRDAYDWHQATWKAFPGRGEENRAFLTRLDALDRHLRLLILSRVPPSRPEWCPEPSWGSRLVPEGFFDRPAYRFSLVANPTRKVREGAGETRRKNGRRKAITHRADLIAWIGRKGEQHGFAVRERDLRTLSLKGQHFIRKGRLGLHVPVEFQGMLRVTDSKLFRAAAASGVGTAKAFGFGLLLLDPTPTGAFP